MAKLSVLLAMEDRSVAGFLAIRCQHLGLRLRTTQTAADTIARLQREKHDLLIADASLLGSKGLDVLVTLIERQPPASFATILLAERAEDVAAVSNSRVRYLLKEDYCWERMKMLIGEAIDFGGDDQPPQPRGSTWLVRPDATRHSPPRGRHLNNTANIRPAR